MIQSPTRRVRVAVAVVALGVFSPSALAAPPDTESEPELESTTGADPAPTAAAAEAPSPGPAMLERAQAIDALRTGTLDLGVDERSLLKLPVEWLDAGLGGALSTWLVPVAVAQPNPADSPPVDPPVDPSAGEHTPAPESELVSALDRFFQQPAEARQAQLAAHASKRAEAAREAAAAAETDALAQQVTLRSAKLRGWLAGETALEEEPEQQIDLRGLVDSGTPVGEVAELAEGETRPLESDLGRAQTEYRQVLAQYAGLEPEARAKLLAEHRERRERARDSAAAEIEAAEAARAREESEAQARRQQIASAQADAAHAEAEQAKALEAARVAETETQRAIAEESARLHGIEAAHADLEAALAADAQALESSREANRTWVARVDRLRARAESFERVAGEADELYAQLRDAVVEARGRLREALDAVRASDGVDRPTAMPAMLAGVDVPELDAHRARISAAADDLASRVVARRRARLDASHTDADALNDARLVLLPLASPELQARVTGFGPDGVRQVRREIEQIGLDARFEASAIPERLQALRRDFATSPVPLLAVVFQALAAFWVFRWWRRFAPAALKGLREGITGRGLVARFARSCLWYLGRIRRPLEVLALVLFVLAGVGSLNAVPGVELVRLVAIWLAVASAAILAVDAMAHRQGDALSEDHARVRLRSLRVIGLAIAWTGLLLSLTSMLVGHGAIYTWVFRLCWFLAIPVAGLVFAWWRPIVTARLEADPQRTAVAQWVLDHHTGLLRPVSVVVGGLYLFAHGARQFALRRAASTESTRRVLAYLFRREVEKRAGQDTDLSLIPIDEDERAGLFRPGPVLDVAIDQLLQVETTARAHRNTFTAVLGERGIGKTTFIQQLEARLGDSCVRVQCPHGGYDELLGALAGALRLPSVESEEAVIEAIAERQPVTVLVDDLDRLVRPSLGGLDELDRFTDLAGTIGDEVDWVATFDSAAWQFARRARGERVFFDSHVVLPRWPEELIGELLMARAKAAGLLPSFEALVLPRQLDEGVADEPTRLRNGFFRIAWDSARGNPAVAIEDWARALARDDTGTLYVRLPPPRREKELDAAGISVKFILRALVQLGEATRAGLADCTQMRPSEVTDALRYAGSRDFVRRDEGVFSIPMDHFRPVVDMLRRQNLLLVD